MTKQTLNIRWLESTTGTRQLQVTSKGAWTNVPTVRKTPPAPAPALGNPERLLTTQAIDLISTYPHKRKLGQDQEIFSIAYATLVLVANHRGYRVRHGDTFRDPRVHGKYGVKGSYSSARSNHKLKLAGDSLLFRRVYLKKTKDYRELGLWWENLGLSCSVPLRWGGRFKDGNHFELARGWTWTQLEESK